MLDCFGYFDQLYAKLLLGQIRPAAHSVVLAALDIGYQLEFGIIDHQGDCSIWGGVMQPHKRMTIPIRPAGRPVCLACIRHRH